MFTTPDQNQQMIRTKNRVCCGTIRRQNFFEDGKLDEETVIRHESSKVQKAGVRSGSLDEDDRDIVELLLDKGRSVSYIAKRLKKSDKQVRTIKDAKRSRQTNGDNKNDDAKKKLTGKRKASNSRAKKKQQAETEDIHKSGVLKTKSWMNLKKKESIFNLQGTTLTSTSGNGHVKVYQLKDCIIADDNKTAPTFQIKFPGPCGNSRVVDFEAADMKDKEEWLKNMENAVKKSHTHFEEGSRVIVSRPDENPHAALIRGQAHDGKYPVVFAKGHNAVVHIVDAQYIVQDPVKYAMWPVLLLVILCVVALISMWVAASIAQSETRLTAVVSKMGMLLMILFGASVISSIGWEVFHEQLKLISFTKKLISFTTSDWVKAFGLMAGAHVVSLLFMVQYIKTTLRKKCPKTSTHEGSDVLPFTAVVIVLLVMIGGADFIFIYAFSGVGQGLALYLLFHNAHPYAIMVMSFCITGLTILYMIWGLKGMTTINSLLLTLGISASIIAALLFSDDFPEAPWFIYMVFLPMVLGVLKKYFFPPERIPEKKFFRALWIALLLSGILVILYWGMWIYLRNASFGEKQVIYQDSLHWFPDSSVSTFLIWVFPLFVGGIGIFFSFVFFVLWWSFKDKLDLETEKIQDSNRTRRRPNETKTEHNWSSISIKVIYLGIFYVVVNVGVSILTVVFLSWLTEQLNSIQYSYTILIFVGVGLLMFLLPPVPGVPVYLAAGIVLVSAGMKLLSFGAALAIASGIAFLIKMLAIILQQRVIGWYLGGSASVRSAVQVNSSTTKAIRSILLKPGLSRDKVAILLGGPDWPTSVLTGILRLPVHSMLIGSIPVLFLIVPAVCSSGFLLKSALDSKAGDSSSSSLFTLLSSITLGLAGISQGGAMFMAFYYIQKEEASDEFQQKINGGNKDYEDDLEVSKLEEKSKILNEQYQKKIKWSELPFYQKTTLIISVTLMIFTCNLLQYMGKQCFVEYTLTNSIEKDLGGNVLNIVKPGWGHLSMGCFASSCFLFFVWRIMVKRNTRP